MRGGWRGGGGLSYTLSGVPIGGLEFEDIELINILDQSVWINVIPLELVFQLTGLKDIQKYIFLNKLFNSFNFYILEFQLCFYSSLLFMIITGFVQSPEFLKKSGNLQTTLFPDLEKVWKLKAKS